MARNSRLRELIKYPAKLASKLVGSKPKKSTTAIIQADISTIFDDSVGSLTASRLSAILTDASVGNCSEQANLIQYMLEKDTILSAHFETRRLAVMSCDMSLVKPKTRVFQKADDPRYEELWDDLTAPWGDGQDNLIYDMAEHLLDATPTGYSGVVLDWADGGSSLNGFVPIHPTVFEFDKQGNGALRSPIDDKVRAIGSFHPNQFAFSYYKTKPGIPCRGGLGRVLAWLFYFKHFARKSWARYLEKFGIPFLVARMADADFENTGRRNAMIAQMRNFASDGAVVSTEEGGIEVQSLAGHHNQIHEEFVMKIDHCFALAILGQLGSSEGEAGRLGNNTQQEQVLKDRKEADCRRLMATIQAQVINPAWYFKYGTLVDAPRFIMDYETPEDKAERAEIYATLNGAGYIVDPAQVSHEMNVELIGAPTGKESTEPKLKTDGDKDEEE